MTNNLGNKKTMANNLKYYMNKNNISRNQLSSILDIAYTTLADWLNAKTYPRIDKIEMLANYFGIEKSDLVEERTQSSISNQSKKRSVKIPVVGQVVAGIPIEAIEDIIDYEEISEELARSGEFFGLQIKGDSMTPRIQEGDVVIVKKQSNADSGNIVIAKVNGDDACCKKLIKKENAIILQSFNPAYQPLYFDQQEIIEKPVTIIGRVVELRGKF